MKIIRTRGAIELADNIRLLPYNRYVLPDNVADAVARELVSMLNRTAVTISHFNSYERRYSGQKLESKSLLIYRHAAFGDTLICTALVAYLRHMNPDAVIDVYTNPNNMELWEGVGARVYAGFPTFDSAQGYDYHLLFENMLENNSEHDQRNCYDDMYAYAGIDPATVPDEFKRPRIVTKEPFLPGNHIVYHLWASNPNRCYPPAQSNHLLNELRSTFPNRELLIVGKDDHGFFKAYPSWKTHHHETKTIRQLVPTVATAALVICPDSAIGHLAAAFPKVPVISLWGLFHPDDRVKYYANHHPMAAFSVCPHAPCRVHTFDLPQKWCGDAQNATPGIQQDCNAMRAIHPVAIVEKAKALLEPAIPLQAEDLKLLVLTACNSSQRKLSDLTHPLNREYCHAHKIDYAFEAIPDDYDRHPSWYKLILLARFLPQYDYVLWIDTDAAFVGSTDIRDLLREATINISADHNGINCGVMALRNCPQAFDVLTQLDELYPDYATHKWFEQAALQSFIDELDVHYQDKSIWNAYPQDATPSTLIRHWPGMEASERMHAIKSYLKGKELCSV